MTRKIILIWTLFILSFGCSYGGPLAGFNAPHVKDFTNAELTALSAWMPDDYNFRFYGGAESYTYSYPQDILFIDNFAHFLKLCNGTNTIVFPRDYKAKGTVNTLKYFEQAGITTKYIEYDNELWYGIGPSNIWEWFGWYWISKERHRQAANAHLSEYSALIAYLNDNGVETEGKMVFSVPLKVMDNADYRAYAEVIAASKIIDIIDIHVYVNQRQGDFFVRLNKNLEWLRAADDWKIVCFEYYGLWHFGPQRLDLDLKNSNLHKTLHWSGIASLNAYGITEILLFTLASNDITERWQNSPVFNAYTIKSGVVILELDNVL